MVLAIQDAWARGVQRPAVLMPTGSGKSLSFSALAVIQESTYHRRPLILTLRDELIRQTVDALKAVARPHQRIGVIQAQLDESSSSHIVVASVQTLGRAARLGKFDPSRFDLIICDEAHLHDTPSSRRIIEHFGGFDATSSTKVVGLTATMSKSGKHQLGELWDEICFERDIRWGIAEKILCPVSAMTVTIPDLDLSAVRTLHGDFQDGDLGKAMAQAKAGSVIAAAYSRHGRDENGDPRRAILFAPTIETAEQFCEDIRALGIPAECVFGSTPTAERQAKYEATRRGTNRVLCSVMVLTFGFDMPQVSCAIVARPTKSRALYIQAVGRALRISPDKADALILDCVGASRLGLASIADLRISEDKPSGEFELDDLPLLVGTAKPKLDLDIPEGMEFVAVDPFSGVKSKLERSAKKKSMLFTTKGVPFLPSTTSFESTLFLDHQGAGLWNVCEAPKRGTSVCHELGLPLPLAMEAMFARYPVTPRKLVGEASSDQMMLLVRFGVEFDANTLTKQLASELISVAIASRRLDG